MGSAGSHIVTARDETQGMPWQAAEYVPYYGSDVKAVRGMLDAAADAATNALPKIDSAAQITEMVNQGKQVVDQIDEAFDTLNTIVEKIPG